MNSKDKKIKLTKEIEYINLILIYFVWFHYLETITKLKYQYHLMIKVNILFICFMHSKISYCFSCSFSFLPNISIQSE